uniref:Uncharacterized protein n=1 Tax=Anopheles minimus TaxID=112268 RepID=A0A182W011_9DIPT
MRGRNGSVTSVDDSKRRIIAGNSKRNRIRRLLKCIVITVVNRINLCSTVLQPCSTNPHNRNNIQNMGVTDGEWEAV